ncbi:MAG: TadE/TadG family type IV pilus assembly protein [Lautropia sp.]
MRCRGSARGASALELLLALPVVLLLGLGLVQFTLVYQAKHALDYALTQAARQGAVDHASREAIIAGLASGLAPYLSGASDWPSLLVAETRAAAHVGDGIAAGWIRLVQRSPTVESFDDWAQPALDAFGEPIAGVVEIPNDNLDNRRLTMQPASGVDGLAGDEPIGRASGQSLADANLLRLELTYGVQLIVPVIGPIVRATLAAWDGCGSGGAIRLGLLALGESSARAEPQPASCAFYQATDAGSGGRIPVRLSATIRMMSTARRSALTVARVDAASGRVTMPGVGVGNARDPAGNGNGNGNGDGDLAGRVMGGTGPAEDAGSAGGSGGTAPLSNGFLQIGSNRPYSQPGRHPALCAG